MADMESFEVAGVDGCKKGWVVAIVLAKRSPAGSASEYAYNLHKFWVAGNFAEVLRQTGHYRAGKGRLDPSNNERFSYAQ